MARTLWHWPRWPRRPALPELVMRIAAPRRRRATRRRSLASRDGAFSSRDFAKRARRVCAQPLLRYRASPRARHIRDPGNNGAPAIRDPWRSARQALLRRAASETFPAPHGRISRAALGTLAAFVPSARFA